MKTLRYSREGGNSAFKLFYKLLAVFGIMMVFAISGWSAIAYRDAISNSTTGGTSLTVNKPSSVVDGDVMVAAITIASNTITVTAPSGWTLRNTQTQGSASVSKLLTYYKVASSEGANYTWSFSGSIAAVGGIVAFSGVDTASPIDVYGGQTTASSTSHATPSITTTVANTMLVSIHEFASSRNWTPPTGMTEVIDQYSASSAGSGGVSLEMNYVTQVTAGATGTKTATASSNADRGATFILALKPPPQPPTITASQTFSVIDHKAVNYTIGTVVTTGGTPTAFTINSGNDAGYFKISPAGVIQVNSSPMIVGTYTLEINASNSVGWDTENIQIEVMSNHPPVAVNDTVSTPSHTAVSGNVLTNDSDPDGDTLIVTNPGTFTLSFGSITINTDGSFTYTPGYFTGETDRYTYTISDGYGGTAEANLTISIASECTATGVTSGPTTNFCLRKQALVFGDMKTIGNTLVVAPTTQTMPNGKTQSNFCSAINYTTGPIIDDEANKNNQDYYMCSYKPDSNINATSAELDIPAGSTIKWAGLYLQSVIKRSTASTVLGSMDVKIKKVDDATYQSAGTPTVVYYANYPTNDNSLVDSYSNYSAFIDVTTLFKTQSWAEGNYTVANVPVTTDTIKGSLAAIGKYGAWSLVVIYEKTDETLRSVSVYDGWKQITGTESEVVTVSNFYTPTSGNIDAKVGVFVSEGDKYLNGDNFKSGTITIGTNNNAFQSGVTGDSSTRTPYASNNQGIDIQTYDIGSTGLDILTHGQGSIDFTFSTNYDYYYPSMLAFSTEVYHPKMCYYEDLYSGGVKLGAGAQVAKGSAIQARVLLKNDMHETAEKVMLYRTFSSTMPYTSNSTGYKLNPTGATDADKLLDTTTHVTDALSSADVFDYSTPLSLFSLHAGTGATHNQGGDFVYNQTALLDYNTTANFEGNTSIVYQIAYTMPTIGFRYEGELAKCVDFNNTFGVIPSAPSPVTGDFNVVYADHANGALTSGYYYNLPTQITSRADNYKVISLDSNTLKDINTTVAVELVDADSSAACSTMSRISGLKTWVSLYNTNKADLYAQDIIDGMILYDADAAKKFYQKAGKNVKFRISYPVDGTGGNIIMNETVPGKYHLNNFPSYAGSTCVYPVTATTYNPANGNPQGEHTYTQVPEACGNAGQSGASAMTQHEVNVCLECIYGTSVNYACSKDNFAIRPEGFFVKLNDQNQTNSATKQFMMNNAPSPANKNMASGYRYYMEVNATNHLDDASSLDYNTTENVDFVWNSTQTGCNDDTNKSISFSFANGLADGNVSVNQVGEYRLSIIDTAWAAVDSNTSLMTHHTGSYFMGGTDCTADSAVSSAVKTSGIGSSAVLNGCNISTNHTNSVAGVTYTDSDVTFHPYKFDMSTITFGVGAQPQEINATSGPDFVYMSDMSRTDSMNMSVRATGTISARGENNSTLSNFVDNCYAVNTNLSMNTYNNITLANTDYQVRFIDMNGSGTIYDSNATNVATGALAIPLMTLNDGNFTKDMSGSLNTVTRLNYDRNQTTPLNPMTVQYGTLGFKCVTASECTMEADLSGSHEAVGSKAMDFNVTHVYGRIIPRDVRVFGNVPFVANAWYEGYNIPTLNGVSLAASKNDALWYVNNVHIDANDGDGNVTVTTTPLALPTHSSSTAGMETYQFGAIPLANIPYGGKAHINTDPWLWYGTNALGYLDPDSATNVDCLTHPCFNITVVPSIGATGSAKSTNESTKASKKSDSEVGASGWKSTSDYAPAIR